MAKVTWLGEDELHHRHTGTGEVLMEAGGPSFTTWNGVKFPKGVAVEVTNELALAKARGNKYFKVTEDNAAEPHPKAPASTGSSSGTSSRLNMPGQR